MFILVYLFDLKLLHCYIIVNMLLCNMLQQLIFFF